VGLGIEQLTTLMRPLRVQLENALEQVLQPEPVVPIQRVPRIEAAADGSGKQWVETELDARALVLAAMPVLEKGSFLWTTEALLAKELGIEPDPTPRTTRGWSPQGQIVEVFLEDYLLAAYGPNPPPDDASPFNEPTDFAFQAQIERLHAFLAAPELSGHLIAVIGGVAIATDNLPLDADTSIVRFTDAWRDELWRIAGWGSTAAQPLQSQDFFDVSHVVAVQVTGQPLGGWDWAMAQTNADRASLALLLCGASAVRLGVSWLRHDEKFASYLSRLGVGAGLVRQPFTTPGGGRTVLTEDQTHDIPELYARLDAVPDDGPLGLALRRLLASSERTTAQDRLIDMWVAFEALFASDSRTELSYRASLRIAQYVGQDTEERRAIFKGLRRAYDWRSHLVHGSDPDRADVKKMGELTDAVTVSEQTLRRALCQWLRTPANLEDIDARFLE
jgi:Apea-like HEPN